MVLCILLFLCLTHNSLFSLFIRSHCRPSIGALLPCSSKITPQPRNGPAVLVIGAYNYPFGIALMAVAGSLAAGNPTVIKPSELCPASAALLSKLVQQYFDPSVLQVVEGGIPETTALLEQDWGMIHFTGSERVGKVSAVEKCCCENQNPPHGSCSNVLISQQP